MYVLEKNKIVFLLQMLQLNKRTSPYLSPTSSFSSLLSWRQKLKFHPLAENFIFSFIPSERCKSMQFAICNS